MQWGGGLCVLEGREVGETEVKCCAAYGLGGEAKTTSNVVCVCVCWRLCMLGGNAPGTAIVCANVVRGTSSLL
jgi:hypothetical protein